MLPGMGMEECWRGGDGEQGVSAHWDEDGGVLVRGCICSQGWAGDTAVSVIRVHLHTGMVGVSVGVGDGVYLNPGIGLGMRMEQCW